MVEANLIRMFDCLLFSTSYHGNIHDKKQVKKVNKKINNIKEPKKIVFNKKSKTKSGFTSSQNLFIRVK